MKRASILIYYFFILLKGYSQQIAFKPTDEFSYQKNKIQISYPYIFMEDVNNDGVLDYYAYLSKGDKYNADKTQYDSTIDEGYYRVIRNIDGSIRSKIKLRGPESGPCALSDFNNDNKKDLLVIQNDSVNILYRTDSLNHINKCISRGRLNFVQENNIVSDINGDGLLDIVSACINARNNFYILYQRPNDSFYYDTLSNLIKPDIYNSHQTARLKIGDFNHDGKKDFLIYSYLNSQTLGFYIQQDSGKFTSFYRGLPNRLFSIAVLDYNHDGRDDIIAEVTYPTDSLRIIAIPQTNIGISSLQYTYNYRDNYFNNLWNSGDKRLVVCDLNCDGYPEIIQFGENCDTRTFIFDTKYDTTFSNQIPFNLSQKIGKKNYEIIGNNFFDWNGDGRIDLLGAFTYPIAWEPRKYTFFKNISINDNTNLTLISRKSDTMNTLVRLSCNKEMEISNFIDTIKIDTVERWEERNHMIINPETGKIAEEAWILIRAKRVFYYYGNYKFKSIYEDSLFLTSGNVCGGQLQDTLRRRVLKLSYAQKDTLGNTFFDFEPKSIDTTFSKPASISEWSSELIKLYPIPSRDRLNISLPDGIEYNISFYNNLGECMRIPYLNFNSYDVSSLESGVYIAIIQAKEQRIIKKFIVDAIKQ